MPLHSATCISSSWHFPKYYKESKTFQYAHLNRTFIASNRNEKKVPRDPLHSFIITITMMIMFLPIFDDDYSTEYVYIASDYISMHDKGKRKGKVVPVF